VKKTIAANWAIYCRCAALQHLEDFGYTVPRANQLLASGRAVTFHTASPKVATQAVTEQRLAPKVVAYPDWIRYVILLSAKSGKLGRGDLNEGASLDTYPSHFGSRK